MKIIGVDNFDREMKSDTLVAENVTNSILGAIMVGALNDSMPDDSETFFKLVEDNYKLFKFKP